MVQPIRLDFQNCLALGSVLKPLADGCAVLQDHMF